jgi:hypothetical protein
MGHHVQAVIAPLESLRFGLSSLRHARVVPLGQGLGLAPITDELFDEITGEIQAAGDDPHPGLRKMSPGLAELAVRLSDRTPVAYIETDYFGGKGAQAAIAWDRGRVVVGPLNTGDGTPSARGAINRALRYLGVALPTRAGRVVSRVLTALGLPCGLILDEFGAVGLGRFRSDEDWIEQPLRGKAR